MDDYLTWRFRRAEASGLLDRLDAYWQAKAAAAGLPSRRDLDPLEFSYALGNVSLLDVLRAPLAFRFRLVASNVQARFASSLKGSCLEDLPEADNRRLWGAVYRRVLATGRPQSYVGRAVEDGRPRLYRARIWPLASNRRRIDALLCCREPCGDPGRRDPDPAEDWERRLRL